MSEQLGNDMDEDEKLYKELDCWCGNGKLEKADAIKASTEKVEELKATIESLSAGTSDSGSSLKELEAELAADKQGLAQAVALREKQLEEFHNMEKDNIQALENLKAAIVVLSKHHGKAPESSVAGGPVFKTEEDAWSFLAISSRKRDFPWASAHESASSRSFDEFLRTSGFDDDAAADAAVDRPVAPHKFLQQRAASPADEWTAEDKYVVQRAMQSATAFVQAKHSSEYFPSYDAQSGEILGVLKQLQEQMAADLKESQDQEKDRAASFQELRTAKEEEIKNGERMAEEKEDQLANGGNSLAEAKEDLGQEEKVLAADQAFLANLDKTCGDAEKNFEERKKARMEEMRAVAETINILQADEARDTMSATYAASFLQVASASGARHRAAAALRAAARRARDADLSILATSVQLDSFSKVKETIDTMIAALKVQQEDEVKKNDWCKDELHQNDMDTAKKNDQKADLEALAAKLDSEIKTLNDGIAEAKAQIVQLHVELQRASDDRMKANKAFQQTVADQTVTQEVLKKALDRLATFYDLLQQGSGAAADRQTPPVPQMEYKPNAGATGVMEMIEKLIHEAQGLLAEARKSESDAQAAYEQTVADTNRSVEDLQKEVVSKSQTLAETEQDKRQAESDHTDTVKELEGLAEYAARVHKDCDYLLKNFDLRQKARQEEVEALQQAKSILNGASLA